MKVQGIKEEIKGMIFDLDGLLVDSEKLYWQANIQAAREAKLDIPDDSYLKLAGASVKIMEKFYHKYFDSDYSRDEFIKRTDDLVWQWTTQGRLHLQEGVKEALNKFKSCGIKMGIASSNYQEVVEHDLEMMGIEDFFDFKLTYLDVQKGHIKAKPAPDIYLAAAKMIGIPKRNLLVFEDSPTGVEAASSAGIKVVMIPDILPATEKEEQNTTLICSSFFDFLKKI